MKKGNNRFYEIGPYVIIARSKEKAVDLIIDYFGYELLQDLEITPSEIKPMSKSQMRSEICSVEVDFLNTNRRSGKLHTYIGHEGVTCVRGNYYDMYKSLKRTKEASIVLEECY